ncbi:MAG: hypothetical protein ABSC64_06915 [Candidatus Korobacteraceae bacterium]|jgi:hypothetical protein
MDFLATKNFKLTERFNLQFRGEFYDLFNHHNNYILGSNLDIEPGTGANAAGASGEREVHHPPHAYSARRTTSAATFS